VSAVVGYPEEALEVQETNGDVELHRGFGTGLLVDVEPRASRRLTVM
jgi:hypothetical protein